MPRSLARVPPRFRILLIVTLLRECIAVSTLENIPDRKMRTKKMVISKAEISFMDQDSMRLDFIIVDAAKVLK